MKFWSGFLLIKIFIQIMLNPNRTDLIIKGVRIASKDRNHRAVQTIEQRVLSNNEFAAMFKNNYIPEIPNLSELSILQKDTFGYAVYLHMKENNLTFDIFPRDHADTPIEYLSVRIYQDHDLWHALMNKSIELEDELAIQAFGIAQFESSLAVAILAGGLINLLYTDPLRALTAIGKINEGYNLGQKAPFLLSVKLHELFTERLDDVRQRCGLALVSR